MRKIFGLILAVAAMLPAAAQKTRKQKREERRERINAMIKAEEEGVIAYHKHTAYGFKLLSDGYGAFLEIGRAKSVKRGLLFQLEITERKHPKEDKQLNLYNPNMQYIYGKVNYFYPVRLGAQLQFLLGNKSNKNGVSVTANIGGGISIGLLRPYMLEILDNTGKRKFIDYKTDSFAFLNPQETFNAPGFGTGWNKLKVTPGIYLKPAFRFDYGRYNEAISALEVGMNAEFYTQKIQQMARIKEKQFFLSAYVAIVFGRRK